MATTQYSDQKKEILKLEDLSLDRSLLEGLRELSKSQFSALKAHLTMCAQTSIRDIGGFGFTRNNGEKVTAKDQHAVFNKKETKLAVLAVIAAAHKLFNDESKTELLELSQDSKYMTAATALFSKLKRVNDFEVNWNSKIIEIAKHATTIYLDGGNKRDQNAKSAKIESADAVSPRSLVPSELRSERAKLAQDILQSLKNLEDQYERGSRDGVRVSLAPGTSFIKLDQIPRIQKNTSLVTRLAEYYSLVESKICGGLFSPSNILKLASIDNERADAHLSKVSSGMISNDFMGLELLLPNKKLDSKQPGFLDPFFLLAIRFREHFGGEEQTADSDSIPKVVISVRDYSYYENALTFFSKEL